MLSSNRNHPDMICRVLVCHFLVCLSKRLVKRLSTDSFEHPSVHPYVRYISALGQIMILALPDNKRRFFVALWLVEPLAWLLSHILDLPS